MNWAGQNERQAIRPVIRAQMRARNLLDFCDEDGREFSSDVDRQYAQTMANWRMQAGAMYPLQIYAVQATSTDHSEQDIGNTVPPDNEFWSSRGSSVPAVQEVLLYRLHDPLARPRFLMLSVYRAMFQHGDPLYPPQALSLLAGPSPSQLYPASPLYPLRLTEEQQAFPFEPSCPVATFIAVRLHGRMQRQWEDMMLYIAIRHISVRGEDALPHHAAPLSMARAATAGGTLLQPLTWRSSTGAVHPAPHGAHDSSCSHHIQDQATKEQQQQQAVASCSAEGGVLPPPPRTLLARALAVGALQRAWMPDRQTSAPAAVGAEAAAAAGAGASAPLASGVAATAGGGDGDACMADAEGAAGAVQRMDACGAPHGPSLHVFMTWSRMQALHRHSAHLSYLTTQPQLLVRCAGGPHQAVAEPKVSRQAQQQQQQQEVGEAAAGRDSSWRWPWRRQQACSTVRPSAGLSQTAAAGVAWTAPQHMTHVQQLAGAAAGRSGRRTAALAAATDGSGGRGCGGSSFNIRRHRAALAAQLRGALPTYAPCHALFVLMAGQHTAAHGADRAGSGSCSTHMGALLVSHYDVEHACGMQSAAAAEGMEEHAVQEDSSCMQP